MKRTLIVLCAAFTFGFVGHANAQSDQYGGQTSTSSKSSHKQSKQSREVTLTGCLEQGASANVFVLRNATEENEGGSSTGTSGSSMSQNQQGTSGQSQSEMQGQQSAMDFQLTGKNKDLKRYVGQRVEVRGKIEPMKGNENESGMSSQGTSGQTGSMSGTAGTSGQGGSMGGSSTSGQTASTGPITHRVKVSSVKQLASSCQ